MTHLRKAAFIVFLVTFALAQTTTHTTVRHHHEATTDGPPEIAQAEDAIQKNDFAAAETLLNKALDPETQKKYSNSIASWSCQAWFDLAFALNGLHRTDESIAAYRKSVAAKPDVFESNLNLGLMLARAHNPDAEQFLRAATTLKPTAHVEEGQARAWHSLAHVIEERDPKQALDAYAKAAELTPADTEPHISAALLNERQNDLPAAEAEYKKVLALDLHSNDSHSNDSHSNAPNSTEAAIGLTNIYMKSNRLAEAEPLLRKLAADRPDDAGLHIQLARILAVENKNDDAIAELETAVKLSPKDAAAQRDLADLYATAKKNDLAEAAYRSLLTTQPNDPGLHRDLGRALLLQKKFPEAEKELVTAVRLKRDSPDVYVDLAFAANENKNYDLTVRALNSRAKLNNDMPAVCYFLRASAYDHLGDWKQASADYHLFLNSANGKYPDQEWQARHRLVAIEPKKR